MHTTASPHDIASFLLEYEQVPWDEIRKTARETPENRTLLAEHVSYMLSSSSNLIPNFYKDSDRAMPCEERRDLAEKVVNIILAA